ncbi:MAG: hypothetical protein UR84_C0020G0002 [candidate division WS6 bacterium GW2011_GWD1_35_594]|nr:MAG: hypothetical protein UR84_C0020G0002 [candidate division WS6 bacterium GW2011_GWD1_35_594]
MLDILISKLIIWFLELEYWGVFLSALGVFPTEISIALFSATSEANIFTIALVSAVGASIGSIPTYFLGYLFTEEKVYFWLEGRWKFLGIERSKVEKSKEQMRKKAFIYVFITRLVPWLRVVTSIAAGFLRVNLFIYSVGVFGGVFLYSLGIAYIGDKIGYNLEKIMRYIGLIDRWLILFTVGYFAVSIGYKNREKISKWILSFKKTH